MNRHSITAFTIAAVMSFGAAAAVGQDRAGQRTLGRRAAALEARLNLGGVALASWRAASAIQVVGFVWTDQTTPVAYPSLAIRDLTDGRVAATTTGTDLGEFHFMGLGSGSYVIELRDGTNQVQAVSEPLTVVAGDTVGTFLIVTTTDGTRPLQQDFSEAASSVFQTADAANLRGIGGGNAASSER